VAGFAADLAFGLGPRLAAGLAAGLAVRLATFLAAGLASLATLEAGLIGLISGLATISACALGLGPRFAGVA
jgi:hypothetical protein